MSVIKKHKEGEFGIVHACCLIVTTRDNALMREYDYLMKTRALGLSANTVGMSEQKVGGMSKTDLALSPRQTVPKKYPRAHDDIPPPHKSAHNKTVCTDSKGNQASKTSTAEAFPLPPFCYAFPVVLFLAFCIARTGRKNNRIQSKQKREQEKQESKQKGKQTSKDGKSKQAQARELASLLTITIQAKQITPL